MKPDECSPVDSSELSQSIKASLCLTNVEDFGEWPILLSARAQKDLRDIGKANDATFQVTMNKIGQLSKGQFSRSNHKLLNASKVNVPIYGARLIGDRRMIYQIDSISDPRNSYGGGTPLECQAIRIFGIFPLAELHRHRFWNTFSRYSLQQSPQYIERCTLQTEPQFGAGDVISPAIFPPLPEQDEDTQQTLSSPNEEEIKEIHSILILDKFAVLSQPVLNSIKTNKQVSHIPPLSTREWEIVENPTSCYVIGRGGTGKTMTMLLRMLGIHRAWQQFPGMGPKPRQVFVTKSPSLAANVEDYFEQLMSTFEATTHPKGHTTNTHAEQETELAEQEDELIGQEYTTRWRSGLPERFSELMDEHFPLFVTYDKLCEMLENDIFFGNRYNNNSTTQRMLRSGKSFISYNVFESSYWDRFPKTTTRKLDPALVFGEFVGVIEGSEDTVGTKDRCLDRESYLLNTRGQATLSHKRNEMYDLFELYKKRKEQRQEYDAADRTHYILEGLHDRSVLGRMMDFLYVDEVQDYLIIDTRVLRMICANRHGLFWAGDTAQTISVGSSFRFADLKAYQYRIEKQLLSEPGLTPVEPKTFELVLNYRSHSGIVNCARSVVELIVRYWPHSIDVLKSEHATTPGFRPIFFGCQDETDLMKAFPMGCQGGYTGLGVERCVLVRNDIVKERLVEKFPILGDNFFMTLDECKGLEFNDVILYNFFEDSVAGANQWRLILNDVSDGGSLQSAPVFDETRHASLCMELKSLYVAITRARQNLWIVDSSASAEPMKKYWSKMEQIIVWPATTGIPKLVDESTLEEWLTAAKMMFRKGRYAQASVAYGRANQERKAKICDAYVLQEKAALTSTTDDAARTQAFVAAAKAFVDCARNSPYKAERLTCYEAAGDCYKEARDLKKAANNYRQGERYDKASLTYKEAGCVDEMVEMITQHKGTFAKSVHERLMKFAQMHYFKCLDTKAALKLFNSVEEALEFVEDWELDEARVKLLTELDKVLEAADIHAKKGKLFKAIETLNASATRSAEHVRRIIQYILAGLRRGFTFGVMLTPTSTSATLQKFLALADGLDESAKMEKGFDEVAMFQAIQRADYETLRTLAKVFIETRNDLAAVLSLDHVFSRAFELQGLTIFEAQEPLSLYLDYIRLLTKFLNDQSVSNNSNKRRLFGFQALGEGRWLVPQRTILHEKLTGRFDLGGRKDEGYTCGYDELRRGIEAIIKNRILDRTTAHNRACREAHGFSPCLRLLVRGKCNPPACQERCTFQHIQPEELTADWYHARLRLVLLQLEILSKAHQVYLDFDAIHHWIGVLYSALYPPFHKLGSFANLDISRIPEADESFRIVREMIRDACLDQSDLPARSLDFHRQRFIVACTLAFDLNRKDALSFVDSAPMCRPRRWPQSPFLEEGQATRPIVRDFIAFLTADGDYSLALGSSYLSEVLRQNLQVDLNALCDFIERLSGLLIMARRSSFREGKLHNIVLPRSWFINLILPGTDLKKDTSTIFEFAVDMIDLLQRVDVQVRRYLDPTSDSHVEQFCADGYRVTGLTGPLYIARICLCLCLVGHNIYDIELREKILAGAQSLRRSGERPTPQMYKCYADAKSWDDLVNAFAESLKDSPFDELILLIHADFPAPIGHLSKCVRVVTHSLLEEVPDLLSMAPNPLRTRATSAQETGPRDGDVPGGQHNNDDGERRQEKPIASHETRVDAAKTIQAVYRQYLKRKDAVPKGIDVAQADRWRSLRQKSKEMEWPKNSQYYILFRVPLGSVLASLDTIAGFLGSERAKVHQKLKKAGEITELEAAMGAFDKLNKLRKRTVALKTKLDPSSAFHENQSARDLQQAVREAKAIVEGLRDFPGSFVTRKKIKETWDRGSKWIFETVREGVR